MTHHHLHIVGTRARDRQAWADQFLPGNVSGVCHRVLRGPYTGLDTVLTQILPDAQRRWPDLVEFHRLELLDGMPDLAGLVGPAPMTLASTAPFEERTRFFSGKMIRCMNQGIVTFLREYARRMRAAGMDLPPLFFDGLHEAESSMQEFVCLFLRRISPTLWPIAVGSSDVLPDSLAPTLARYAEAVIAPSLVEEVLASEEEMIATYFASDGTSDDPAVQTAYERLDPAVRRRLHDQRAAELVGVDTARFALAFHHEHGSDPGGAGVVSILAACEFAIAAGFSQMVLELAVRGRALASAAGDAESYRKLSHLLISAMISTGQFEAAEVLCHELRHRGTSPVGHMIASYLLAMLNTRFKRPRDHETAVEWQNNAIVIARLLPDDHQRLVMTGFQENGMALIEMHRGNFVEALQLVEGAITRLDTNLDAEAWALHRSQLVFNKARLLAGMGRQDEAYQIYSELAELDPRYTDYLVMRARISHKRGDLAAAIADYDRAIELGPPFPELFHNRASAYAERGEFRLALADFDFVLDMEPDDVESLLSRAELLFGQDDVDRALTDVEHGLELMPHEPRLLCLRGAIRAAMDSHRLARRDFEAALRVDPNYPAALVNLAIACFEMSEPEPAAASLTKALELIGDDPDLLLNRGIAYAALGKFDLAIADYDRARALPDADLVQLDAHRASCRIPVGAAAQANTERH
jgi:tetratricopeptide (TPR) repeat protein